MARELAIDVEVNALQAEVALGELEADFRKLGHSVEDAEKKAKAFERTLNESSAKKKYRDELSKIRGEQDEAAKSSAALTQAVMRYAGPAVVVEAARRTLAWADNIQDLAERTNLSVEYVQQLTKVAEKNGTTFQTMANLIQANEQRLAGGNKKALETLRELGLEVNDLLAMNAEERFRAQARALASIADPAKRSAAEMALFGRSADGAAAAINAVAEGADKAESALGPSFIAAGARAQDMLDDLLNTALDLGKAFLLWPAVLTEKVGNWGKESTLGTAFEMMGLHGSRATAMPGMPATPGAPFMPSPLAAPGDPFAPGGVGGNSLSFIEKTLGIKFPKAKATTSTWAYQHPALSMPMHPWQIGGIGPGGQFPGWATPMDPLANTMTRSRLGIGFDSASVMAPFSSASMVSPASLGAGGSLWSRLSGGKLGAGLGVGMGLLSNLIPGLSRTGSSVGGTLGSIFGPLGSGIGSLAGGLFGKLFGGNDKKNAANAEISKVFEQFSSKEFIAIQKEADRLGISMEKALNAKTMKDYGLAVDEVTAKLTEMTALEDEIAALTDASTVGFDQMNAVVQEFGLDISKLGPAFQQAALDKEAQRIIDAFAVMEKGGADMNGVLEGMADEISTLVQDSIKFGTTIPENMRPWIEKLKESGKLVDANGLKLEDTSQLKFGAPMESEMDKVVKKLDELITKLADLPRLFGEAQKAAGDLNREVGSGDYGQPGTNSGETPGFASGGVAGRDWRRAGPGDVIPALLRRGERVLPPGVSGGAVSIHGLTVNVGHGQTEADFVESVGRAVVAHMRRRGVRLAS